MTWKRFSFQQMDIVLIVIFAWILDALISFTFQYHLCSEFSMGNQFVLGCTPTCHPNLNRSQGFQFLGSSCIYTITFLSSV
jgi:hypothetical protein